MLKLRWTGCAGVEIMRRDKTILIDPYHTRLSKWKMLFGRHEPNVEVLERHVEMLSVEISAIIVGHTHVDHAMDVPVLAKWCRGPVVGSGSLKNLAAVSGLEKEITVTRGRETIDLFEGCRVTMIPSRHGTVMMGRIPFPGEIDPEWSTPLKARQYRLGDMFIPKLEVDGTTFLHVGSANLIDEELEGHRCDVLLVSVPGWNKVPAYIKRLVRISRPRVIIPIHFDDFSKPIGREGHYKQLPFIGMEAFMDQVKRAAPHSSVRKPRPFQALLI